MRFVGANFKTLGSINKHTNNIASLYNKGVVNREILHNREARAEFSGYKDKERALLNLTIRLCSLIFYRVLGFMRT